MRNEGWFDAWSLLLAFKKKAKSMGVHFVNGEVTGVTVEENQVKDVKVSFSCCKSSKLHKLDSQISCEQHKSCEVKCRGTNSFSLRCSKALNK